jgi:hypothetical protein
MPTPSLPEPVHPELDSMLSRKFGKEVANYFAGMCDCLFFSFFLTFLEIQD